MTFHAWLQLIVLSIVAGTLLIRPIMYTNSVPDGQLFVSLPFAMMVGLMMDNFSEMSITLESMHVMFRQRANCFYPGWAYAMPTTLLRIPYSFLMAFLLSSIIYWVVGYDSNPGRCTFFYWLFCLGLWLLVGFQVHERLQQTAKVKCCQSSGQQ